MRVVRRTRANRYHKYMIYIYFLILTLCADALDYGGLGLLDEPILVRDDAQATTHRVPQFPWLQQEIRVRRTAIALIAERKCLVDQQTLGRQGGQQMRKQGPVKVIRHDDG